MKITRREARLRATENSIRAKYRGRFREPVRREVTPEQKYDRRMSCILQRPTRCWCGGEYGHVHTSRGVRSWDDVKAESARTGRTTRQVIGFER